jgi:hypothetical protein
MMPRAANVGVVAVNAAMATIARNAERMGGSPVRPQLDASNDSLPVRFKRFGVSLIISG